MAFIPPSITWATDGPLAAPSQGDVLYYDGTKWAKLAAGTAGYALLTGGAGANPSWGSAGVTAHSGLTGLTSGDDHTRYVYLTPGSSTRNVIQPSGAGFVPLTVQGAASQSAHLQDWTNSAGTVQAAITSGGDLYFAGSTNNRWANIGGAVALQTNATNRITVTTAGAITFYGTTTTLSPSGYSGAGVSIAPYATSSGSPTLLAVTGPAHTTLTASTEAIDVSLALARTVQFATGALTTQRAVVITPPTYAFVGASTITTAVTLDVTGAPVAGTNATITNSYALRVQGTALFTPGSDMLKINATGIGFFGVTPAARASAYTPTNVTTDRSYDANATTLDELADVVGTLIADLQAYGLLQ